MGKGDESDDIHSFTPYMEPQEFPPPSSRVKVSFGAQSRCGNVHTLNEDHYLIIQLGRHQETLMTSLPEDLIGKSYDEYAYAMIVADGMGGFGGGEVASRLALTTLMELVLHFGKWNLRVFNDRIAQEIMGRAEWFYRHVDSAVMHQGLKGPVPRLQTTLTATFSIGRDLFVAHVGHSRAYLFRDRTLMPLTHDHTISRQESSQASVAPLMNVAARDLKHVLTKTIGMSGAVGPEIDIERGQLADGDRVLVCTNGLTDMVDEAVVAEVLASDRSADDQCRVLVDLAMAAGGDDDVTALVALYHIPE